MKKTVRKMMMGLIITFITLFLSYVCFVLYQMFYGRGGFVDTGHTNLIMEGFTRMRPQVKELQWKDGLVLEANFYSSYEEYYRENRTYAISGSMFSEPYEEKKGIQKMLFRTVLSIFSYSSSAEKAVVRIPYKKHVYSVTVTRKEFNEFMKEETDTSKEDWTWNYRPIDLYRQTSKLDEFYKEFGKKRSKGIDEIMYKLKSLDDPFHECYKTVLC